MNLLLHQEKYHTLETKVKPPSNILDISKKRRLHFEWPQKRVWAEKLSNDQFIQLETLDSTAC
jgi:hypothetical protein